MMEAWFSWIESTPVGRAIAESLTLTASLSAVHLLGFTLVMGGNFSLLGWVRAPGVQNDVPRACNRAIVIGGRP